MLLMVAMVDWIPQIGIRGGGTHLKMDYRYLQPLRPPFHHPGPSLRPSFHNFLVPEDPIFTSNHNFFGKVAYQSLKLVEKFSS